MAFLKVKFQLEYFYWFDTWLRSRMSFRKRSLAFIGIYEEMRP